MTKIDKSQITGLILAGGRGTRMGEVNKGLQLLQNRPLIAWVIQALQGQVAHLMINANQDLERYQEFGFTTFVDRMPDYAGPLAGIHAGLKACNTDYLVSVPCDSPFLADDIVTRLTQAIQDENSEIAVAYTLENIDGVMRKQVQPVFSLIHKNCLASLEQFLNQGERKIRAWHAHHRVSEVHFENVHSFMNLNTLEQLQHYQTS
jgi:molybdopterin-guanine dinucleotide biosynthesis protein A